MGALWLRQQCFEATLTQLPRRFPQDFPGTSQISQVVLVAVSVNPAVPKLPPGGTLSHLGKGQQDDSIPPIVVKCTAT